MASESINDLIIQMQLEIQKVDDTRGKIKSNETFGGAYGFLDQEADLLSGLTSDICFYRNAFAKLHVRMKNRINEYQAEKHSQKKEA